MDSQSSAEFDKWISDDEWEDVSPRARRRLLRNAFGVTADAVALAGCSQGRNEDTPTSLENEDDGGESMTVDDDSTNQSSGRALDHIISLVPTNARFNPYGNAMNSSFRWYWAMLDQLAAHDKVSDKTKGIVTKDWEYAGDGQVAWNIRDTYAQHSGDDLTAGGVVTQLKIGKPTQTVHRGYGAQPPYENVETTRKYELTFDLVEPDVGREILEFGHVKRRAWLWVYRDT